MSMFSTGFDQLEVGSEHRSPAQAISTEEVAAFAALTGDHHPAHIDPQWAAAGPFGRPIAHGLLILSCASGSLPLDPERVIALRRIRDVVFKRPLTVGGEIVVVCRVSALRAIDEASGLVECEWRIIGTDERLMVRALVEILWARDCDRPVSAVAPDETDDLASVQVDHDGLHVLI